MIHINVQIHEGHIVGLNIHGHAQYVTDGLDVVCAGVSSIGFGLCNALDIMYKKAACTIANNIISIKIDEYSDVSDIIMKTAVIQLETIEESYKKNVKISKQEV